MSTIDQIVRTDLRIFNEMTVELIVGISKLDVLQRFRGTASLSAASISDYLDDLEAEGLIENDCGVIRYKKGSIPV
jgi:hypothetical protein